MLMLANKKKTTFNIRNSIIWKQGSASVQMGLGRVPLIKPPTTVKYETFAPTIDPRCAVSWTPW